MKIIDDTKTTALNEKVFEKMDYKTAKIAVISITGINKEEFVDDILADLGKSEETSAVKNKVSKKARK